MNKHSYLSTLLVDLNNIKMYSVDKQYKNRRHIDLNAQHLNKTANVTAAGNMNVHELFYLICVILMFCFLTWNITLETLMLICLHSSISVGLNRSPFTADLVHKQLTVLT